MTVQPRSNHRSKTSSTPINQLHKYFNISNTLIDQVAQILQSNTLIKDTSNHKYINISCRYPSLNQSKRVFVGTFTQKIFQTDVDEELGILEHSWMGMPRPFYLTYLNYDPGLPEYSCVGVVILATVPQ